MALAMPSTTLDGAHPLVVAGHTGELFGIAPDGDNASADALGFVRGDAFGDLDRLMPCDPDGDGVHGIISSTTDALDPGYYVYGPLGAGDAFGKRTPDRRHQAARCVDIDDDGRDDLVGLVSQTELGIVYGQSWGLPDGIDTWVVPSIATDPSDPEFLWQVVTSAAADLDDNGTVEWIWAVRGRGFVRIWSLDTASAGVIELPAVEVDLAIDRIDLADLDGDGTPDLVTTGVGQQDAGAIAVVLGDGAGGFGVTSLLLLGEPMRRMSSADIDDDGDDELIAVGGWAEGIVALDYADGDLEIIASFPALANDAVALRFDANDSWDLAILHADTWHVEILRDAFAPARD